MTFHDTSDTPPLPPRMPAPDVDPGSEAEIRAPEPGAEALPGGSGPRLGLTAVRGDMKGGRRKDGI